MRITAVKSRILSSSSVPIETYEQTAGLNFPDLSDYHTGYVGRFDKRHVCVYPRDRTVVVVCVESENGLCGYGEAHAPVAPRVVHTVILDLLAPVLLGQDARQIAVLWERMFSAMRLRSHTQGFTAEAISGIDIALWDLLGKLRKEPVWMMLGGAYRRQLPMYSSGVPGDTTDERITTIERLFESGFNMVKASCGRGSLEEQIEHIRPIANAIGKRGRLLVDAHGGFDLVDAQVFANFLKEQGNVEWLEDPLVPEDSQGYSRLTESTFGIRIAMGETECNRYGVRDRLLKRQCDVLLPDVCRAGGITETLRIAQLADSFGVSWASHVSVSTPIHLAAGLQVGAATPNFLVTEYPTEFDLSPIGTALCTQGPEVVEGSIMVSDAPGLGVELDEAEMERLTWLHDDRRL